MLDYRRPPSSLKFKNHELNNQGCKCKLCQRIIFEQNRKIIKKQVLDYQSQCYSDCTKQNYIQVIDKLEQFDSNPRKIKFSLPQICVFNRGLPECLITKKKQKDSISIIKNKSKLHLFEIFNFFLQGFIYHNPGRTQPTNSIGRRKSNYLQLLRTQPVVLAKYVNNSNQMLNLTQVEGLFKSKFKYLKDGLMYLQTLVGSKDYSQKRIRIIIERIRQSEIFERAKREVKIIIGQIKQTDNQYINEVQQSNYQKQIKKQNIMKYLEYIVLKIVLLLSKKTHKIMQDCLFKIITTKDNIYLWDIRVYEESSSQYIWAESAKAAFEYKLAKQMKKMQSQDQNNVSVLQFGFRTKNLSQWLYKSTQKEMKQISSIRNRLDRLQDEKRSLMQSQSCEQGYLTKPSKIKNKKRII